MRSIIAEALVKAASFAIQSSLESRAGADAESITTELSDSIVKGNLEILSLSSSVSGNSFEGEFDLGNDLFSGEFFSFSLEIEISKVGW